MGMGVAGTILNNYDGSFPHSPLKMRLSPNEPCLDGIFPNKNYPAIGDTPMAMETPIEQILW